MAKRSRSPEEAMHNSHSAPGGSFAHRWWNYLIAFADIVAHPQKKRRAVDLDPTKRTEGYLLEPPTNQETSFDQQLDSDSHQLTSEDVQSFDTVSGNVKPSYDGNQTINLNTHSCTETDDASLAQAGNLAVSSQQTDSPTPGPIVYETGAEPQQDTLVSPDLGDVSHPKEPTQSDEEVCGQSKDQSSMNFDSRLKRQATRESYELIDKTTSQNPVLHDSLAQREQDTPLIDAAKTVKVKELEEVPLSSTTFQLQSSEEPRSQSSTMRSQSSDETHSNSPTNKLHCSVSPHLEPPGNQSRSSPQSLSQAESERQDESDQHEETYDYSESESDFGSDDLGARRSICSENSSCGEYSTSSDVALSETASERQGQESGAERESEDELESESENEPEAGFETKEESDTEQSWDHGDSDEDDYAYETHHDRNHASKSTINPSVQRLSSPAVRQPTEVVVIDDSDDESASAAEQSSDGTQDAKSKSVPSSRYAVTPVNALLGNSIGRLQTNASFAVQGPRESSFSPNFGNASDLSTKRLFRVSTATKRISNHAASVAKSPRLISSLNQRRKTPLGHEEFKAQMQSRQQARIASMVYETYRALSHQTRSPPAFADFQSLVKKRSHVQHLLDLENAKAQIIPTSAVLDEQTYTQRTLDDLRAREAKARLRLPVKILSDEQQRAEICAARAERRAKHGILGRKPLPSSLPTNLNQEVNRILQQRGIIASMTGAQVEAHDLAKLRPGQWLNDEVINFYGTLIQLRANEAERVRDEARQKKQPVPHEACAFWSVHFFNSYFWQKLQSDGYKGVQRWSRRVDLFTKDLILLPINLGQSHWVCAAINLRLRRFEYYDSIGIARPKVFESLRDYLAQELQVKKQLSIDWTGWEDYFAGETSPQQANGFDCGVFAIQTLEQVSRRDAFVPMPSPLNAASFCQPADSKELAHERMIHAEEYAWNFSQEHMPYLRRRMVHEIASKQLLES